MALVSFLLKAGLIYVVTRSLWRVFRSLIVRSPLDNIPGPVSRSYLKGNLGQLFDRHGWDFQQELREKYGPVVVLTGVLGSRRLFVYDPVALHSIINKDHDIYELSPTFLIGNELFFGKGLISTTGVHHRKQRKMLNPVFSINHMRHMVPLFYRIAENLRQGMSCKLNNGPEEMDVLDWMARTALELIGQGGLGYSFGSLNEGTSNAYGEAIKRLLPALFSLTIMRQYLPMLVKLGPPAFRRWVVERLPMAGVQRIREVVDDMDRNSREILETKRKALEDGDKAVLQQVGEGNDIVSRLLQANAAVSQEDQLDDAEILGQMSTLSFAATDTTSSALARILHLLAENQDVQDKLRREIIEARDAVGELSYDELEDLPYLDAVCRETLRLHSPVNWVTRVTNKDTIMPLSAPLRGVDGTMIHEIPVPKKTTVVVGIAASNRNPAVWGEDAAEWKPERWLSALPDSVHDAHIPGVYSHLMTFLGGGRACIGFKFSQLEIKVVLTTLLTSFVFSPGGVPIVWNLSGVQYPTVGTESTKPQLPLKVELVKAKLT